MTDRLTSVQDVRPVPDPTVLTGQLVDKAVASLREIVEARLDGMDHATALLQTAADRLPSEVDTKVAHLRSLHAEKFESIQTQFRERDIRTEQTSRDSKTAVDAALSAAKEAVGAQTQASDRAIAKSEAGTTKQIDQFGVLIQTTTAGLDAKISDIKDRLLLIEGRGSGYTASWAAGVAVIGILTGIAGFVFAVTR